MKGYLAKAGQDLKAEVKNLASSAWGVFNKALKGAVGGAAQAANASAPQPSAPSDSPSDEPVPSIGRCT